MHPFWNELAIINGKTQTQTSLIDSVKSLVAVGAISGNGFANIYDVSCEPGNREFLRHLGRDSVKIIGQKQIFIDF
jgi:hypothetical protein